MKRVGSLDLLRSIAILSVLSFHVYDISKDNLPLFLKSIFDYGWVGVDLFFILSGFLISMHTISFYERNPKLTLFERIKTFWVKRWFRTLPLYFFILLLYTVIMPFFGYPFRGESWRYVIFSQNFMPSHQAFLQSWSLAVEEHFYLVFPFLFFPFAKAKWRKFLWVGLIFLCLILKFSLYPGLTTENPVIHWATYFRLDSLAWGVLLAETYSYWKGSRVIARLSTVTFPLFLFLFIFLDQSSYRVEFYFIRYTLLSLAFSSFLIAVYEVKLNGVWKSLLYWVAVLSYGAYVWFALVVRAMSRVSMGPWYIEMLLYFLMTFILAFISYIIVEKPFMKWRKHILSSKD